MTPEFRASMARARRRRRMSKAAVAAFARDKTDRRRLVRWGGLVCGYCVREVYAQQVGGAPRYVETGWHLSAAERAAPCEFCGEPSGGTRWMAKKHQPILIDFYAKQTARIERERRLKEEAAKAAEVATEADRAEAEVEAMEEARAAAEMARLEERNED